MSAVLTIAAELFDLTRSALDAITHQQRRAYELVHGIDQHGQTEPLGLADAAAEMGVSRSSAGWHLAQAESAVWRKIAMHLVDAEVERRDADEMPSPGETVVNRTDGSVRQRFTRSGNGGCVLGEGSETMVREAKRSDGKGRVEAMVRAQRELVRQTA